MALKKQNFSDDEVAIFDDAVIYKREEYWHFRMWLTNEGKYARKSLKTRSRGTAIEKAKEYYLDIFSKQKDGKKYFSITTKEGVELYLKHRQKDVESGLIVAGRHATIKTHLQHWLDFIKKDTKLKDLHRNDCEDYLHTRLAKQTGISVELVKEIFTALGFGAELKNNPYNAIRGALAKAARKQYDTSVRLDKEVWNNLGAGACQATCRLIHAAHR